MRCATRRQLSGVVKNWRPVICCSPPRFKGHRKNFKDRRNGGIGAFTPDNVPIFDWILPNAYMIADSNHGFKMTGVGKLVAKILAGDNKVEELEPFRFSRFTEGRTFGASNSHCPWV